jgi:hypothetical protein
MTIHRRGLLGLLCTRHVRTQAAAAAATAAVLCGGATAVQLLLQQPRVAACQPQQQPTAPPHPHQILHEPSAPDSMRTQAEGSWRLNLGRTRCTAIARLPARLHPHARRDVFQPGGQPNLFQPCATSAGVTLVVPAKRAKQGAAVWVAPSAVCGLAVLLAGCATQAGGGAHQAGGGWCLHAVRSGFWGDARWYDAQIDRKLGGVVAQMIDELVYALPPLRAGSHVADLCVA